VISLVVEEKQPKGGKKMPTQYIGELKPQGAYTAQALGQMAQGLGNLSTQLQTNKMNNEKMAQALVETWQKAQPEIRQQMMQSPGWNQTMKLISKSELWGNTVKQDQDGQWQFTPPELPDELVDRQITYELNAEDGQYHAMSTPIYKVQSTGEIRNGEAQDWGVDETYNAQLDKYKQETDLANRGARLQEDQFAYGKTRDTVKDAQWQKEFDLQTRLTNAQIANYYAEAKARGLKDKELDTKALDEFNKNKVAASKELDTKLTSIYSGKFANSPNEVKSAWQSFSTKYKATKVGVSAPSSVTAEAYDAFLEQLKAYDARPGQPLKNTEATKTLVDSFVASLSNEDRFNILSSGRSIISPEEDAKWMTSYMRSNATSLGGKQVDGKYKYGDETTQAIYNYFAGQLQPKGETQQQIKSQRLQAVYDNAPGYFTGTPGMIPPAGINGAANPWPKYVSGDQGGGSNGLATTANAQSSQPSPTPKLAQPDLVSLSKIAGVYTKGAKLTSTQATELAMLFNKYKTKTLTTAQGTFTQDDNGKVSFKKVK
jgi:hypothetical protein